MKTRLIALARSGKAKLATGGAMILASGSALAEPEISSQAEAAFTQLQAQATELAGYAWPVVVTVVGALLAIGLFKRFANKAT